MNNLVASKQDRMGGVYEAFRPQKGTGVDSMIVLESKTGEPLVAVMTITRGAWLKSGDENLPKGTTCVMLELPRRSPPPARAIASATTASAPASASAAAAPSAAKAAEEEENRVFCSLFDKPGSPLAFVVVNLTDIHGFQYLISHAKTGKIVNKADYLGPKCRQIVDRDLSAGEAYMKLGVVEKTSANGKVESLTVGEDAKDAKSNNTPALLQRFCIKIVPDKYSAALIKGATWRAVPLAVTFRALVTPYGHVGLEVEEESTDVLEDDDGDDDDREGSKSKAKPKARKNPAAKLESGTKKSRAESGAAAPPPLAALPDLDQALVLKVVYGKKEVQQTHVVSFCPEPKHASRVLTLDVRGAPTPTFFDSFRQTITDEQWTTAGNDAIDAAMKARQAANAPNKVFAADTCVVCLCDVKDNDVSASADSAAAARIVLAPCGHANLHHSCAQALKTTSAKLGATVLCPECRAVVQYMIPASALRA